MICPTFYHYVYPYGGILYYYSLGVRLGLAATLAFEVASREIVILLLEILWVETIGVLMREKIVVLGLQTKSQTALTKSQTALL
jgi:hypothetical protein